MKTKEKRVSRESWWDFDGVDCPTWLTEEDASSFCSVLNAYIPYQYASKGCRYHILNHFQGGLWFHLLNRPVNQLASRKNEN